MADNDVYLDVYTVDEAGTATATFTALPSVSQPGAVTATATFVATAPVSSGGSATAVATFTAVAAPTANPAVYIRVNGAWLPAKIWRRTNSQWHDIDSGDVAPAPTSGFGISPFGTSTFGG